MSAPALVTNGLGSYTTQQKFLMLGLWITVAKGSASLSDAAAHAAVGSDALRGAGVASDAARGSAVGSDS